MSNKRIMSPADLKTEKEAQYKRSMEYAVDKARDRKARIEATNGNNQLQSLKDIMNAINNLTAVLIKTKNKKNPS